ncbi:MAG: hypothetical protein JSW28_01530 [Thermoplasmata archaeon]|nr:MAG: hypothetical protein JSW28_01530 [Thermoplasmata archaeon]
MLKKGPLSVILWLTNTTGQNYINPSSIGISSNWIVNFIGKHPDSSVVIIDDLTHITKFHVHK